MARLKRDGSNNQITDDVLLGLLEGAKELQNNRLLMGLESQGDYTCSIEDDYGKTDIDFVDYYYGPDELEVEIGGRPKHSIKLSNIGLNIKDIIIKATKNRKLPTNTRKFYHIKNISLDGGISLTALPYNLSDDERKRRKEIPGLAGTRIDNLHFYSGFLALLNQKIDNCDLRNSWIVDWENLLLNRLYISTNINLVAPTKAPRNVFVNQLYVEDSASFTDVNAIVRYIATSLQKCLDSFNFLTFTDTNFNNVNVDFGEEIRFNNCGNDIEGIKPSIHYNLYAMCDVLNDEDLKNVNTLDYILKYKSLKLKDSTLMSASKSKLKDIKDSIEIHLSIKRG